MGDTLDVYNAGCTTSPSSFICQAYRLFTMPLAEDISEISPIIDHAASAVVRCVGFIYMRFVIPPMHLWSKFEEYVFDDQELVYTIGGKQIVTTIGEYVEQLLAKDKYFNTPLPRIPVRAKQQLERELAPLLQYRKRMEANRRAFKANKVLDMPVEVCIDGGWVKGLAKELLGRPATAKKLRVLLDDGNEVNAHLGKVILRGPSHPGSGSDEEEWKRMRDGEVDWSRFKGQSEEDLVHRMRERAKYDATVSHGKVYAKRPLREELALAQKFERGSHEQKLLEEDRTLRSSVRVDKEPEIESEPHKKRRLEEEQERQKKMREIYEKYGSQPRSLNYGSSSSAGQKKNQDIEAPEVLRLG